MIGSIAAHPLSGVRLFILPLKGVGGNISKLSQNLKMVAIDFLTLTFRWLWAQHIEKKHVASPRLQLDVATKTQQKMVCSEEISKHLQLGTPPKQDWSSSSWNSGLKSVQLVPQNVTQGITTQKLAPNAGLGLVFSLRAPASTETLQKCVSAWRTLFFFWESLSFSEYI